MNETAPGVGPVNVPHQVVDLAVVNIAVGGGLFLGALSLLLLSPQPVCFAEKMTPLWVVFWLSAPSSVLAGVGLLERLKKGWSASRRRFVTALGAAGLASPVLLIGLTTGWDRWAAFVAGTALLIAGLAILRAWRWGAYFEIASMLAGSVLLFNKAGHPTALYASSSELIFCGNVLLVLLFICIAPFSTLLFGERRFILRFSPIRSLLAGTFKAFVIVAALAWILIPLVVSPQLIKNGQRRRQRKSMEAMRAVMAAVERYGESKGVYPATQSVADLARLLEPAYIPRSDSFGQLIDRHFLPRNDGWGRPLEYSRVVVSGHEGYVIRSAGCDGIFEQKDPTAYTGGGVQGMERDLVFSTVVPPQWPEGEMAF